MFGNMGNMGNMAGMMKKVQKLQADMAALQEELKTRTLESTAGGGAIKVVVNGDKQIVSVKIDPAAVVPEDIEMLEDMIMAAINEALKKVDDMMAQEMGKLTGGLKLPGGMF
jgi:DNA-binding YbaB/EbfC family protein